jgi:hypothetical protein
MNKAETLANQWGYDCPDALAHDYIFDSLVPAICSNPDCDYSTDMEPDQGAGHCENCGTNTLQSILIMQGLI